MAKQKFKITKFTNPSGEESYRLSGTLNGERIRKNYKTRDAAVDGRQKLNIRLLNEENDGQTVWTTLTHKQNQDAISAVNMLEQNGSNKSLSFAVKYFLQHYKEAAETMTVEEAVDAYLHEKSREEERGLISPRQERAIGFEMNKFQDYFAGRIVGEIQADEIKEYLDAKLGRSKATASVKTYANRRGYVSTFFKFCFSKKYVAENPIVEVPQIKVRKTRGTAQTLSAAKSKEFMHWLESYKGKQNKTGTWWGKPGCMVPYFALTLFAGIRPDWKDGEIKKLRFEHIRLDTEVIFIEPDVSKTNEKRIIKIQPNLRLWLERYPLDEYPIIPVRRFRDMWVDVREKQELSHDVMRHTYISMNVAAFRSVGDASLQAGNSETVVRKHYLDLKTETEADSFWNIVPEGMAVPANLEKKDGRYVVA